ncbi:glycosyl hydrolase family 18 protein [Sulfobacillus thermosulfidooxidans]|uniref:Spore germination protein YaaH n=1 Tax=Sulfobacillus thermosulfidooxidans (strain DSM 9293 / VKM B-1269 / AT-1) TaxID=929705 RepID=A0A1W1WM16_SULTA|nr:glycosyl hydrolase family 18 protein [Sulfobacillus thermosulfidooxidans]OLZ09663.1 glycoside hydrolase [Sulfobacillus thermosulfidooxidans]OLZ16030.1 glycoside hydrolase [Sulfobacillus thermosulfidooxidans]OLZ18122.1 glycoside hydrolase [Sulfobacillus thermosulfidooxidans]SMC07341.1 Spore germination protein YaaH [Sulfobacillus thermosulfidooxidans DSM 9293]
MRFPRAFPVKVLSVVTAMSVLTAGCGIGVHAANKTSSSKSPPLKVLAFWANDVSGPLTPLYTHSHAITDLAPFWYSLDAHGGLISHVNSAILHQAEKEHIAITPLINDGTGTQAFLASSITRVIAARNIADLVGKMHYQGVNIDFEPPHTRYVNQLTGFMIDLRDFLPRTDTITMDVVPHSGGAYNFSKLAPEVNQFVLMSYDEHDDGSPPGPVAALGWVENILSRMLHSVPASKIDLGIALYGYSWPVGSTHATTIPYNAITTPMIQHAKWSTRYQETYADYTTSTGPHIAWWESLQGMNQKIQLAKKDHLAGIALWHIGYANNAVMQLLLHQIGRQP